MKTNRLSWALVVAFAGCAADEQGQDDGGVFAAPVDSIGDTGTTTGPENTGDAGDTVAPGTGTPAPGTGTPAPGTGTPAPGTGTPAPGTGTSDASSGLDAAPGALDDSGTPENPIDAGVVAPVEFPNDASSPGQGSPDATLTIEQYCSGKGPVVKIPGGAAGAPRDVCTGTIANQVFKNALCVCENANIQGFLNTGSFSASEDDPDTFTKAGGAVGINGSLGVIAAGYTDVGGSLRIYEGASFGGYINVYGDFEMSESATVAGLITVERDARFRGDTFTFGDIRVGRDLYTRPGKWEPPLWSLLLGVGGDHFRQEFTLEKPCACEPKDLLDVDAIVRDGKLHNDNNNPQVKLDPGILSGINFVRRVEIPCGRYYLDEISGVGDIRLIINGRTTLFVGGNVSTIGHFDIDVGPQGELDLFIGGNLTQVGFGQFGDWNRPSSIRIYVGGDGDIFYRGFQPIGGNIYAPRSRLHSDGYIDAKGSIFVRTIDDRGYLRINYDRDILNQGDDDACKPPVPPATRPDAGIPDAGAPDATTPDANVPPPPECNNACDGLCGSLTCKGGMCTSCSDDLDCCEPLVCYPDGRCGPLLF